MEIKEFLGMVIREAGKQKLKFIYTPKESSKNKVTGLFVLEKTGIESGSDD